ncbi:uncharacterized protein [Nicotiana sylvestris]|uniref:uncharacterized protein n=1 Tax=Nicotiana sylvestris TaxID=4096 RepID=UPI00388C788C
MAEAQEKPKDNGEKEQNIPKEKQVADSKNCVGGQPCTSPVADTQQVQRGRALQNNKGINNIQKRGRSAPSKQAYKPTGAILCIDKPHRNMDITHIEQNTDYNLRQGTTSVENHDKSKLASSSNTQPTDSKRHEEEELWKKKLHKNSSSKKNTQADNTTTEEEESLEDLIEKDTTGEEAELLIQAVCEKKSITKAKGVQKSIDKACMKDGLSPRKATKKKENGKNRESRVTRNQNKTLETTPD